MLIRSTPQSELEIGQSAIAAGLWNDARLQRNLEQPASWRPQFARDSDTPKPERLNLFRALYRIPKEAINVEERTVELSFCSEAPYERWFGVEILDCKPESVLLGRLNGGGALLKEHNRNEQTGVVIRGSALIEGKRGLCKVKFSKSKLGNEEFQDVQDEIRTLVSVGYIVHKMVLEKEENGVEYYRVTLWEPYEVSIVSIPADPSVGIGKFAAEEIQTKEQRQAMLRKFYPYLLNADPVLRSGGAGGGGAPAPKTQTRTAPEEGNGDPDPDPDPAPARRSLKPAKPARVEAGAEDPEDVRAEERHRVTEIQAIASRINNPEVSKYATKAIGDGTPLDVFSMEVLTKHYNAKPIEKPNPEIGMSEKEVKRYSICRAVIASANGKLEGLEREASAAAAKIAGREPEGFFIPHDIASRSLPGLDGMGAHERQAMIGQMQMMFAMQRALNAGTATQGGYTVPTELLGGSMIELLRNKTLVNQLGVRTLSGLQGNIAIPRVTGGATAYWLSETGEPTEATQAFGQLALTPKRLAALTAYNKQLLMQSSIDVEAFVRDDLMRVLALEKDRAFINGSGASGEPIGIINTTGINTITYGAAATWEKVVENETTLATSNADSGSIAFLTTPAVRGKWKTAPVIAGQAVFLWGNNQMNGGAGAGIANGYPAHATNQVPSDKTIFGNWADGIMAEWAGIDVVVDPFTRKKSAEIEIQIQLWTDNGIRHAVSFVVSTDSGAQ